MPVFSNKLPHPPEILKFEVVENVFQSVLILFHSKSRELLKSVLGFVKIIIVALDPDDLGPFLPDIVRRLHFSEEKWKGKI